MTELYVGILEISDDIFDGFVKGCVCLALMCGLFRIVVEKELDV